MLSPRYLAGLSDDLIEIYSQLEIDILRDMARRLAQVGKITEATKWQAQVLTEAGGLRQDIARILHKYDKRIVQEIQEIFNDALIKNARADNRIFAEATGRTISDNNAQMMLATIKKTHEDLSRLTLTSAEVTNKTFLKQANNAYMQVTSGAFDYDTAMKMAANEIAKNGVTTMITYTNNAKPVRRSLESAVRMNILTGVNQTASQQTMNNCEALDCDLVEVTAHIGARPEHEEWQGKVYSVSGKSEKYPPFSVCGYGEADGICGINCRHSFYPYFEGMEKHYSQEDLDEMSKETVDYNGKSYSRYEGEQQLRHIERTIRHYKKEAATQDAMGIDNTAARCKIGEWQAKARDFKPYLKDQKLAMIFEKSSTRTRVSFDVGMNELGGHALFLSSRDIQLGGGEPIKDTARVISRMCDLIMARVNRHETLIELAEFSRVPVINGLSDKFHPVQLMADLMTITECGIETPKIKAAYVGDGNNMTHSLMYAAAKVGMNFAAATPEGYGSLVAHACQQAWL